MNIERFHNELAMRLGYERIVNDKRFSISLEESDDPCVILFFNRGEFIRIMASTKLKDVDLEAFPDMKDELRTVFDAVNQAYIESTRVLYTLR